MLRGHLIDVQMRSTQSDQPLGRSRLGHDARSELDDHLHLLTQVGVRHAEDRGVGDLGMRDEQALALLRIDVAPPEMIMKVQRSVRYR